MRWQDFVADNSSDRKSYSASSGGTLVDHFFARGAGLDEPYFVSVASAVDCHFRSYFPSIPPWTTTSGLRTEDFWHIFSVPSAIAKDEYSHDAVARQRAVANRFAIHLPEPLPTRRSSIPVGSSVRGGSAGLAPNHTSPRHCMLWTSDILFDRPPNPSCQLGLTDYPDC